MIVDSMAAFAKKQGGEDILPLLDQATPELEYSHEDWGVSFYRLELTLPSTVFAGISNVDDAENRLQALAEAATKRCSDGKVTAVVVTPAFDAPSDWRTGSRPTVVSAEDSDRIWRPGWFRLFLSHKAAIKGTASQMKEAFARRNIDVFVAHADIKPSRAWQQEIILALGSCHAIAGMITPGFHQSVWCMQEVGWGLGRGILVLPVKFREDPKGFLKPTQALFAKLEKIEDLREPLVNVLAANSKTARHMMEPLVASLEMASDRRQIPVTTDSLERLPALTEEHAQRVVAAISRNQAIKDSVPEIKRLESLVARFGVVAVSPPSADEYDPFADE